MEIFFGLGNRESFRFDLPRVEAQAHRLVCMGPRRTKGGHHFDPAIHHHLEIKIETSLGPSQVESRDERIQQSRDKDAESVTANSNFEKQIVEDSSRRNTFNDVGSEGVKGGRVRQGRNCNVAKNLVLRGTQSAALSCLQRSETWQPSTGHCEH